MNDLQGQRVLFVCDFGIPFTAADFRGEGVGGTEACVVLLAEAYAARGADVVVANRVGSVATERGVRYMPLNAIPDTAFDAVVLWKHWSPAAAECSGQKIFIWTDVHIPDRASIERCRRWADVSFTLSDFQRMHLAAATGESALVSLGCAPIDTSDYSDGPGRKERLLVYCSAPDRGLFYLKDLFPRIRRQVPDARLAITSDFSLWGGQPAKAAFMRFFEGHEGVDYLGHVSRSELVAWQQRARVMAYPCNFEEGFCLAAAECLAAGTVPVTTKRYALVQTVGDGGVLIPGHPRGWLYRRRFVRACVELLTDDQRRQAYVDRGRARALREFSPAHVLERILEGSRVPRS